MSNQITEQQLSEAIKQNVLSIAFKCVFTVPDSELPTKIEHGIKAFMSEFIKAVPFRDYSATVSLKNTAIVSTVTINHIDGKFKSTVVESVLDMEILPIKSE